MSFAPEAIVLHGVKGPIGGVIEHRFVGSDERVAEPGLEWTAPCRFELLLPLRALGSRRRPLFPVARHPGSHVSPVFIAPPRSWGRGEMARSQSRLTAARLSQQMPARRWNHQSAAPHRACRTPGAWLNACARPGRLL